MHFEADPPEVNSGRMYAGPGAESLEAAASAWSSLRKEMMALERSFNRVLLGLMDSWSGPAVTQAVDAAKPFARWLTDLSEQLSGIFWQIHAIVVAYDRARDEVVPPDEIADNRAERRMLIKRNAFGRYNAQIANLDQEYEDFWEADGYAMRAYRLRVLDALSRLTPWQPPPPIVNDTRLAQPVLPSSSLSSEPLRPT
ncbi:PPE family protein [Mycobacterium haemophilum DSM 44634]|uniref:PPE family protein n=1 Tax=Mycobacterium haemophilum TaxID=29311 RepID=UPI000655B665|nr:PPE family protein [Mycobacterium haemophilum]AKN16087.1 hypothetical protein B586_05115 [Mycobacterium haemophilum DSM 44634]MCV7342435.1 PPE family protein [Mycobacterium haemophilum DSM 44634]